MFEPMMEMSDDAVIKVVGVGGGGGNAVEHMVRESIEGVEFISVNTDAQALRKTSVGNVIQIGGDITKGLGAGANPQVGREAALEDRDRIKDSPNWCRYGVYRSWYGRWYRYWCSTCYC